MTVPRFVGIIRRSRFAELSEYHPTNIGPAIQLGGLACAY